MPQIRPITDLRNTNANKLDVCHAVKEPIFITKNGYGDLVVMSIETYEQIVETQVIDHAISEAEEEYEATGILLDARDTLASLRRRILVKYTIKMLQCASNDLGNIYNNIA